MSIISTNNLSKIYHESTIPVHALQGVNLSIEQGEFTSIVGPSGSGKTTLLNMLGGLDEPNTGNVIINENDITEFSNTQLVEFRLYNIGFVFQAYNLIPVLTALENVEFIMLLQKTNKRERMERALEMLKAVGIADKANHKPGELSGGQQQRVAVARALASKPKFVLADEPTANLDTHSAENLLNIMLELNKKNNTTFIFSTHDDRVIKKARRVVVLEDGKIKSDETK